MDIELINELKKYVQEGKEKIADISKEYSELTALTHTQTFEDKKRIKQIQKEVKPLAENLKNIEEDIQYYEDVNAEVNALNKSLRTIKNETSKRVLTDERDSKISELAALEEAMKEKYAYILVKEAEEVEVEEIEESEEAEVEEIEESEVIEAEEVTVEETEKPEVNNSEEDITEAEKKSRRTKTILGVSAIALAIAVGLWLGARSKNNKKQPTTTNDNPVKTVDTVTSTTSTPMPTATPELVLIEKEFEQGFRDINDMEAVAERAQEIYADIIENNPEYLISESEIENMLLWINGGVVENPTKEDRDAMINLYLDLLGRDVREAKGQFDFTKLFLEGTRAQKAAQEAYEVRKDILANLGTDKVNESANKEAELFAKSMNGKNGAQSFQTIENNMSKVFILLANVYNYATADNDIPAVYVDEYGFVYDLNEMMMAINTECIYDDPLDENTEERKTVDLLTSLMDGALLDAKDLKEVKSLKLTK